MVKYHNDFNKIKLPSFTEQEQNILIGIIGKIREKPLGDNIIITAQDLLEYTNKNLTNADLKELIRTLREKFFKADFTILIKDYERNRVGEKVINLFKDFTLWVNTPNKKAVIKNIFFGADISNFESVELSVNPQFAYLVNELTANFTKFELGEFVSLNGKYTKTLYRLLKQFRSSGVATYKWDEFCRIMDIPPNYKMCDIDKDILKPAIRELTAERNLFDQIRIPFKNLQYIKEKGKGRGRGGPVIGISFTFDPENIDPKFNQMHTDYVTYLRHEQKRQDLVREVKAINREAKKKAKEFKEQKEKFEPKINPLTNEPMGEFIAYMGRNIRTQSKIMGQWDTLKILEIYRDSDKIILKYKNVDDGYMGEFIFDSKKHLENTLKKFLF